ncbi:MAG: hypothetical protein Ct9H90mP19_0030 [Gammaproteobacteria bacterium]|nr:MAG: hypothetical protein Ct9H90mP19_0030 [Gammaproteobacteria bacterium]
MDQQWSVDGQMYLDIQLEYLENGPKFFQKTAEKSASFIQLCNQTNTPFCFLA